MALLDDSAGRLRRRWLAVGLPLAVAGVLYGAASVHAVFTHRTRHPTQVIPEQVTGLRVDGGCYGGTLTLIPENRRDASLLWADQWSWERPDHTVEVIEGTLHLAASCGWSPSWSPGVSLTARIPAGIPVRVDGTWSVHYAHASAAVNIDVSGGIDVTGATGRVSARTSAGSVRIGLAKAPERLTAQTTHGDVTITVPHDGTAYDVDAAADGGRVTIGVPRAAGAAARITARTGDGSVRIGYP